MHYLFTFIGLGRYEETQYAYRDNTFLTRFFPLALQNWLQPDCIVFFLTREAEGGPNWTALQTDLQSQNINYQVVQIPSGRTENELWQIFGAMTSTAGNGDSVSFDITHAFRSLPMLGLLAASFLRRARDLDLKAIYYGAFEARDVETGVTPVFELTPFLELLDWMSATNMFITTGDSRSLGVLLQNIQDAAYRRGDPEPPRTLKELASTLANLSRALGVTRPGEISATAKHCETALEKAAQDLNQGHAAPFGTLLEKVRHAYLPLQDPSLAGQARLVRWYEERGRLLQAITLGREWMVNLTCQLLGVNEINEREEAELALNHLVFRKAGKLHGHPSPHLVCLEKLPFHSQLRDLWGLARDLRNDSAHCGFRKEPATSAAIRKKTNKLVAGIEKLLEEAASPDARGPTFS